MKDLLIGIATLLIALIIIGTLIFGGRGTLQGEIAGVVEDGINAIQSIEWPSVNSSNP